MSNLTTEHDSMSPQTLRLSTKISGITFWGAVLMGIIVVAVFIKQGEDDFNARQDYKTVMLLRVVENTLLKNQPSRELITSVDQLRQAIEAFDQDNQLLGAEVRIGEEKVLIGAAPEDAFSKRIESNHIIDRSGAEKMVVTAYFDIAANNVFMARKNLIVFMGVISFAFGLIMNKVLQKMLTNPIDQMIETAAAYADGNKSVRFDDSREDEFGFLSRFINKALNTSEAMYKQLEAAVHEQREAKERAVETLEQLKVTQDRLVQSEKLASLGQLTAGIAHEIKNPLNFINNFSETSVELFMELKQAIAPQLEKVDASVREEIDELLEDLSSDLNTIAKHGKRADSIIKNMLMHSRSDGGERQSVDINALVKEASGLAYHGERATDRSFQVDIDTQLAEGLKSIFVVPQDISRVLINLISNAFHATKQRKESAEDEQYAPAVVISTRSVNDGVEIRIHDNGSGISQANLKNLFTPFFTTKPTGEGTGLGLSISHDIIEKQNAGSLEVKSKEGEYSEFAIWLPNGSDEDKKA